VNYHSNKTEANGNQTWSALSCNDKDTYCNKVKGAGRRYGNETYSKTTWRELRISTPKKHVAKQLKRAVNCHGKKKIRI